MKTAAELGLTQEELDAQVKLSEEVNQELLREELLARIQRRGVNNLMAPEMKCPECGARKCQVKAMHCHRCFRRYIDDYSFMSGAPRVDKCSACGEAVP